MSRIPTWECWVSFEQNGAKKGQWNLMQVYGKSMRKMEKTEICSKIRAALWIICNADNFTGYILRKILENE